PHARAAREPAPRRGGRRSRRGSRGYSVSNGEGGSVRSGAARLHSSVGKLHCDSATVPRTAPHIYGGGNLARTLGSNGRGLSRRIDRSVSLNGLGLVGVLAFTVSSLAACSSSDGNPAK